MIDAWCLICCLSWCGYLINLGVGMTICDCDSAWDCGCGVSVELAKIALTGNPGTPLGTPSGSPP